jgi:hypothetical protein
VKNTTNSRLISLTQAIAAKPSDYKKFVFIAVSNVDLAGNKTEVDVELKTMATKLEDFITKATEGAVDFYTLLAAAHIAEKSTDADEKQLGLILRLSCRDYFLMAVKEGLPQYQIDKLK